MTSFNNTYAPFMNFAHANTPPDYSLVCIVQPEHGKMATLATWMGWRGTRAIGIFRRSLTRHGHDVQRYAHSSLRCMSLRVCCGRWRLSTSAKQNNQPVENINVNHSRFLAEASPGAKWNKAQDDTRGPGLADTGNGFGSVSEGKGKLSPTSSHLFKLILPLDRLSNKPHKHQGPPTVLLLHPSQPLSHVSRLISASLFPSSPTVSFRSVSRRGQQFQWADSTDVGDFIKDAARAAEFSIYVTNDEGGETMIEVDVPTFSDRTRFLRRRLRLVEGHLEELEALKKVCDYEAHRGARRMAVGGFGMLVAYWALVARLTFWDFGWDIMEPITYLSGLSTVICGYLWFLYQGREVSYSSILDQSISSRRHALYKSRGLDIERYIDLVADAKSIRREIRKIAEDYDDAKESTEDTKEEDKEEGESRAGDEPPPSGPADRHEETSSR